MAKLAITVRCVELPDLGAFGPAGLRLGLQRGHEVVDDVPVAGASLTFEAIAEVREGAGGAPPGLGGSYVHGRSGERFLYLCWGLRGADGAWEPDRRAKLQLGVVEAALIARALADGVPLVATVRCTDPRGNPIAASLKPSHIAWGLGADG